MPESHQTAKVKLVTIVAAFQLADRIASDLRNLGVSGYTKTRADGWGAHGTRQAGFIDGSNVRFDTLVPAELASAILEAVCVKFANQAVVACAMDAEAVPKGHFL
jgi:nitrogen regulatory protein PII